MSDNKKSFKYVVVGAGNAAGYAARQFTLNSAEENSVAIIGEEPYLPYERPALSKAVLVNSKVRLPGFHTSVGGGGDRQTEEWYASNSIATILSSRVTSIDATSLTATLSDESTIQAEEAMIVATGASPIRLTRTPGHDLKGIYYLRNYDEALSLFDGLQECKGKNVAVIGGGYIGMEVAAAAIIVGCKVTMVFPESHMMSRLFTPEIAAYYEKLYESKGVKFEKDGALGQEFLGDGTNVTGVRVKRGDTEFEVAADLIVVGVGARPETGLFKDVADIDERGGVIVDSKLQTSVKGLYAIGDIATFPLKMYGDRQVRVEHVQNCRDMAKHVVDVVMGKTEDAYDYLPYFYSRIFHMAWQFFGDCDNAECIVVGSMDAEVLSGWGPESEGTHPQLLAVWIGEGGIAQGVFMESPSGDQTESMKKVAIERRSVDVDALKGCESVEDGWKILLA